MSVKCTAELNLQLSEFVLCVSFFHVHKKSCSFFPPKVQTDWFSKSTHMQQCSHIACHCPVFIHSYCALCCQTAVSLYSCWPSDSASVLYS